MPKGGGGVEPDETSPDDSGGAAAEVSPWPEVGQRAWRLIAPRPDELLALDAIRRRAANAACCTSTAQLAGDLGTTRTRAAHLIHRLHAKGWIVTDCRRTLYLPTSIAGLAYRMPDVERLVRAVAALDARRLPAELRGFVRLARELWDDAGPHNGHVPHPAASPGRTRLGCEPARRRGLVHWWRLRRGRCARAAHRVALRALAAEEADREQTEA